MLDATGVGDGALDLFRAAHLTVNLIPVHLTAGSAPSQNGATHNIPKADLVHTLDHLIHERHLSIAAACPHTPELLDELAAFERTDHASGHTSFAAAHESDHDDLVIATALATYRAWSQHRQSLTRGRLAPLHLPLF
jgi:hypothetical protein